MKRSGVRLACLSCRSSAACGWFAAERPAGTRQIDSRRRRSVTPAPQHGARQQMRAVLCWQPRDEAEHRLVYIAPPTGRPRAHHRIIIRLCPGGHIQTLESKCFQLTTKSSGRPQQLQLCRQRVPCWRCGDWESHIAESSTCPRHDEVARRDDEARSADRACRRQMSASPIFGVNIVLH